MLERTLGRKAQPIMLRNCDIVITVQASQPETTVWKTMRAGKRWYEDAAWVRCDVALSNLKPRNVGHTWFEDSWRVVSLLLKKATMTHRPHYMPATSDPCATSRVPSSNPPSSSV